MGEWFTAFVLDVVRGWIGSSEGGDIVKMTDPQMAAFHDMEERHENERQAFMRSVFHGKW